MYNDEFFDGLFRVYDKNFELENYNKNFNGFLNSCKNDIFNQHPIILKQLNLDYQPFLQHKHHHSIPFNLVKNLFGFFFLNHFGRQYRDDRPVDLG